MTKEDKRVKVDPSEYGLPSRTDLRQSDEKMLTLVIDRKSRIIMKDGKNIFTKVEKIQQINPEMVVTLETTAPVCSKTEKYLLEKGIDLIKV